MNLLTNGKKIISNINAKLNYSLKQLPKKQKLKLTKELEKEAIDIKLSRLLNTFKTDDLDLDTITREVESVRQDI